MKKEKPFKKVKGTKDFFKMYSKRKLMQAMNAAIADQNMRNISLHKTSTSKIRFGQQSLSNRSPSLENEGGFIEP